MRKTMKGFLLIIMLISLGVFALFGMYMPMQEEGGTTPCPWMAGDTTLCVMDIAAHLETWQGILSVPFAMGMSLMMLMMVGVLLLRLNARMLPVLIRSKKIGLPQQSVLWHAAEISITHTILQAFSRGILHPKIF